MRTDDATDRRDDVRRLLVHSERTYVASILLSAGDRAGAMPCHPQSLLAVRPPDSSEWQKRGPTHTMEADSSGRRGRRQPAGKSPARGAGKLSPS